MINFLAEATEGNLIGDNVLVTILIILAIIALIIWIVRRG